MWNVKTKNLRSRIKTPLTACEIALYLLLAGLPLAAAGQNIMLAIATLILLWVHKNEEGLTAPKAVNQTSLIFSLVLASIALATSLNPLIKNKDHLFGYFLGFANLAVLPILFVNLRNFFSKVDRNRQRTVFTLVIFILALVCLSQSWLGWKRIGWQFVAGYNFRAQGFYSHPLTLAYVALIFWPLSVRSWLKQPRNILGLILFLSCGVILWTSLSRVVQMVGLFILVFNVMLLSTRTQRAVWATIIVLLLAAISWFDNPVKKNFLDTWQGKADRHALQYPDDRLAFWHAHWLMFAEKPILGHGTPMPATTVKSAYAKIGLESFLKKYNAHNMFLQIACEGGLLALITFFLWYGLWGSQFLRYPTLLQTWIAFGVCALSQNAIQDSEVRYALALFLGLAALHIYRPRQEHSN